MKNKIVGCTGIIILLLYANLCVAQVSSATKAAITADSLKSGNAKDILTSFFQLGFNNLTGPNKELSFSSNPFALMLKRNPRLNLDKTYKRYKPLRKLNFNFGLRLDSSFNFNGFTSGLKYSLIDETDATTSKLIAQKLHTDPFGLERHVLTAALREYMDNNITDLTDKIVFSDKINRLVNRDSSLSKFDAGFQKIVKEIVKDKKLDKVAQAFDRSPGQSFKTLDSINYEQLKNSIKKNLLWTIGISDSTYKDKFEFANIAIVSELSKGIFEPDPGDNNLEINIKAMLNFSNDTIKKTRNLDRRIFSIESGINWVVRDRTTDRSFFEVKFSGSYYHNFGNLYTNERKDSLTINGTARIRIINDIWIPLEVKYDPKTGKVFGFLNIKANFSGIGALLKGKNS